MEYYYKYDLKIELALTDGVFAFITDAIKRDRRTRRLLWHGKYWDTVIKARKQSGITTITLEHFEKTVLRLLEGLKKDYCLNQEVREFVIDLFNALEKIYEDCVADLKILNDPNFKYTSEIRFV